MASIYFDANIIIYMFEGPRDIRVQVASVLAQAARSGAKIVSSEISIVECLHGACKQGLDPLKDRYNAYFADEEAISLAPITGAILREAAKIGAENRLKTIDAIHVATALDSGCGVFFTNDRRLRTPAELKVLRLTET